MATRLDNKEQFPDKENKPVLVADMLGERKSRDSDQLCTKKTKTEFEAPSKQEVLRQKIKTKKLTNPNNERSDEDTALKKKTKEQWKELVENIHLDSTTEIEWLCHTTEVKKQILQDGKLRSCLSKRPTKSPLATTDKIKGTWFTATVWDGRLLTKSPYGPQRAKLNLGKLINDENKDDWKLFFESTYYYYEGVQYIRLILANEKNSATQVAFQWCQENLEQLDLHSKNDFFYKNGSKFFSQDNKKRTRPHLYVTVLLLDEISTEDVEWDTVEKLECDKRDREPTFGIPKQM